MKIVDWILGRTLASREDSEQKIGILAGVPVLGLDGLSSAAYGPEAALTILLPLGVLGLRYALPITLIILALLLILFLSYRQTISAYPSGGGSFTVARENLGDRAGLVAAAALMLDYILNVAVGISAGVGALVSAVPTLHSHVLALCLGILALITLVNLRGIKESGTVFAFPTYVFVLGLGYLLVIGIYHVLNGSAHSIIAPVALPSATSAPAGIALIWLLMRAFASGCTAMTGVEAVSNGVPAFAEPRVKNAQGTLAVICALLGVLLVGIAYLCKAYGIGAVDPDAQNYQSIISQLGGAILGHGPAYFIMLGSVLAVLSLSANTSFAGFPRLCHLVAESDYLPHSFMIRGRRLVYSAGIIILAILSALLLIAFGGVTDRLIPLFAIGAFLAFTLSQFGMVQHWRKIGGRSSHLPMLINLTGGVLTSIALAIILAAKLFEGAWITVVIMPLLYVLFIRIHRHYTDVRAAIKQNTGLDLTDMRPPLVVVPVQNWTRVAERGLHFALRISPDVIVVHVAEDEEVACEIELNWKAYVADPVAEKGLPQPKLVIIPSPYRRLFGPLYGFIMDQRKADPTLPIAVIIPELQEAKWSQVLLHNQRAQALKAGLLFNGDRMISVINVAWYLGKQESVPIDHEHWVSASS